MKLKANQRKAIYSLMAALGAVAIAFNIADAETVNDLVTSGENLLDIAVTLSSIMAARNARDA